jgi:membrane-bound lytic murein transglycosylase B
MRNAAFGCFHRLAVKTTPDMRTREIRSDKSSLSFYVLILAAPALAARCGGDFNSFVASMSAEAQAAGFSPSVTSVAFGGVGEDAAVLNFDRHQRGILNKSFKQYVSARVGPKPA